jgi:betaine-aldehyde dehydrogenase
LEEVVSDLFIAGRWVSPSSGAKDDVINPADASVIRTVDRAGGDEVDAAISAARAAFDTGPWPRTPSAERGKLLGRVADLLERDRAELGRLETTDTGKTAREGLLDIDDVVSVFRYYAELAGHDLDHDVDIPTPGVRSRIRHEPVGVCTLITPWNYPLLQISWKLAPALAAGNTAVVKPSEVTPLTTIRLIGLLAEAGLPDGVVNLVLGAGADVGVPLVTDPRVDMVSFTGGLATGRSIMAAAAGTVKKIALELGGKNPNIVFADSDFATAVDHALTGAFLHSGQVCSAGARIIVERSIHDDFVAELARRADNVRVGDPFGDGIECGPLVSKAQLDKIERYVEIGKSERARVRCGGFRPTEGALAAGFYYRPTLFDGCDRTMRIVSEEVFGPVATVEVFDSEAEAIALGNDTTYGLAGAVFTADSDRGERVAEALRHGTVWINDYHPYLPQAEWGGMKQSGIGRELGVTGLLEYMELKHIYRTLEPAPPGWFTG